MTQDEQTYSRWYLDYGQCYLDPMGTKEYLRFSTCRVCRGNKDYICVECGELDVQNCVDNMCDKRNDNGDIYILFNEISKGSSRVCEKT
jgi:hypothetical protein